MTRCPRPAPDGFHDFLLRCARSDCVEKPVAYVHGDSHYFRVDKPFLDAKGRRSRTSRASRRFGDAVVLARPGQR